MTTPEKKIVTPTVGRKVWFRLNGVPVLTVANDETSKTGKPSANASQPLDATVVYAWGDRLVNLAITDHYGNNFIATSVPLLQEGDEKPAIGFYCEWMPYQTAQAKKESAVPMAPPSPYPSTRRENIEQILVSGAAGHIAENPTSAAEIAGAIKTVLDSMMSGGNFSSLSQMITDGPVAEPKKSGAVPIEIRKEFTASGPRVTPADIDAEIAAEYITTLDKALSASPVTEGMDRVTIAVIVLKNGTKLVGVNYGAIDPAQHDPVMGAKEARAAALEQAWPLLGFRLRDELSRPVLTDADAAADLAGTPRPG